jgi:hypothetical protein
MNARQFILDQLDRIARESDYGVFCTFRWEDAVVIWRCSQRANRGDESAWGEFLDHLRADRNCARRLREKLMELRWANTPADLCRALDGEIDIIFPEEFPPLDTADIAALTTVLSSILRVDDEPPSSEATKTTAIKYIEEKNGLRGSARIGRVTFSASRKTIYYAGRRFRSLRGGYKANFFDFDSGAEYWISNCKQDGNDTLYPGVVEIDEDARVEYWTEIRRQPEKVHLTTFRSEGKHSKRRPV